MKKILYLILALGFFLRLISINQSIWLDEGTSLMTVKTFSYGEIINTFSLGDFHPPLYYLLLKGWLSLFGLSVVWARMFSVVVGVLSVYLLYLVGKKLRDRNTGLMAAFFLSTSPLHIYYSQEARMYSLEGFLVLVSVYFFLQLTKGKFINWFVFALSLVLIGFTDYLSLLVIPVFWLVGLIESKKAVWWGSFALAHLPLALFFFWWAPYFAEQIKAGWLVATTSSAWSVVLGKSNFKQLVLVPVKFMLGRLNFNSKLLYGLIVSLFALVVGTSLVKAFQNLKRNKLVFLWLVLPITIAFIIGFKVSVFSYFRFIFVLPAFYLMIALGLSYIKEALFVPVFMVLIIFNMVFSLTYLLNPKYHRENWKGLVEFITQQSVDKKTAVYFVANSQMEAYNYYMDSQGKKIGAFGPDRLLDNLDQLWLLRYVQPMFDPQDKLKLKVEEIGYTKDGEFDFNGVVVWKYKKVQ